MITKLKNWIVMHIAGYLAWVLTDEHEIADAVRKEVRDFYNQQNRL